MKEQIVKAKPIGSVMGIGVVLLIVAGLFAASLLSNILAQALNNNLVSGIVYLLAIAAAIYLMREQIVEYHYIIDGDALYLERVYGQRSKIIDSFPILDITEIGEEKAMREKYPEIKNASNLTLRACPLPRKAILYTKAGKRQMAIVQPEDDFLNLLWDEDARRRNREIKWGDTKKAD